MEKVNRLVWAASSSFRIGDFSIGIRSNTDEADRAIRDILAAHLVDAPAEPNYSIRIQGPESGGVRPLHLLFRGCTAIERTTQAREVLEHLLRRVEEDCLPADASVLQVRTTAFVRHGQAVLLPDLVGRAHRVRSHMRRQGWTTVPAELADLELATGRLLVRPPRLDVNDGALEQWTDAATDLGDGAGRVAAGAYPVSLWTFLDGSGSDELKPSKSAALVRAVQLTENRLTVGAQRTLRTLATLLPETRALVLPRHSERNAASFVEKHAAVV